MLSQLSALLFFICTSFAIAEEPSVTATVDRANLYLGETIVYQVEVRNVQNPPEPLLDGMESFKVESLGGQSLNSSSVYIVNGRVTRRESFGQRFVYQLTPSAGGDLVIPSPSVTIAGKTYTGPEVPIRVIEPRSQDIVVMHSRVERSGRYPLQPFTVTLRIFVKAAPMPYHQRAPLSYTNPPELVIPWATPPDGLKGGETENWLGPYLVRGGQDPVGFSINNLTSSANDPFALFNQRRTAVFDLRGRRATEEDVRDVERLRDEAGKYWVYSIQREFEPRRAGTFRLQPTSVKGNFVAGVRTGKLFGELVFDLGGDATVVVDEPPREDRPESWSGGVGSQFQVSAELTPTRVRVGDPMTLSLTLTGRGNLEETRPPEITANPDIASRFRVQDPTREIVDGKVLLTYSLRPISESVTELPPIALSYFDLGKERYVSTHSQAIPVVIDKIESLGSGDLVMGDRRPGGGDLARADGLFGNITDPNQLRDERPNLVGHAEYVGGLAILYAIVALFIRRRQRLLADPIKIRRREAANRARERIALTRQLLVAGDSGEGADQLRATLAGLVADVAGIPAAGLTGREIDERLDTLGASDRTRDEVAAALAACDQLRYGGGSAVELGDGSVELIETLLRELKGKLR